MSITLHNQLDSNSNNISRSEWITTQAKTATSQITIYTHDHVPNNNIALTTIMSRTLRPLPSRSVQDVHPHQLHHRQSELYIMGITIILSARCTSTPTPSPAIRAVHHGHRHHPQCKMYIPTNSIADNQSCTSWAPVTVNRHWRSAPSIVLASLFVVLHFTR